MRYPIQVTQEDIDGGRVQDPHACPIALACIRAVGAANFLSAHYSGFVQKLGDSCQPWPSCEIPDWMRTFDRRLRVSPFAFDLELSMEV